jgi:superoxide dismutase, Fe-Mn family
MQVSLASKALSAKKWDLKGLNGISDATLEMHFGLYEGYVKNTNLLFERLADLREKDEAKGANPGFAELVRRLGFEQNGVRLHELYFDNMTSKPGDLSSGRLHDTLGEAYGGFDAWKSDFAAVGGMRGVGWAIAYYDISNRTIRNYWIDDHQNGHISGFVPVVVMDVWEHAFIKDYKPAEKAKYIEAFLTNVDWKACEARLP